MRRTISIFLGMLILTAGVGFGVLTLQDKQLFEQKAAPPDTTAEKIAEIAKSIGQTSSPNIGTYSSVNLGYKINFDKNYWEPTKSTDLSQSNLQNLNFSLNNSAGNADVNLKVYGSKDFNNRLLAAKNFEGDNLDKIAKSLANQNPPISKERTHIGGRDYYKFTYENTFLNVKSQYYEYITINGGNYYVVTAKYSTFGNEKTLVEQLISSFSFGASTPAVKAASTTSAPTTVLDESKIVELVKPSVFQIAHLFCTKVEIPNTSGLVFLKPNYTFCDGALGSGFAINKDGFIATNGHVVKAYPETALIQALLYGSSGAQAFLTDLVKEIVLVQTGQTISQDDALGLLEKAQNDPNIFDSIMSLIYKLMQQKILILTEGTNKYYVKLGKDPLKIDTTKTGTDILNAITQSETVKEASLVGFNFPNQYTVDAILNNNIPKGSDVAIIKILNPDGLIFPAVKMGSTDNLKEGSDVIVIGYPGVASGNDSNDSLVNLQSSANPTVTKGIISAIKNDQGGLKLIQVDASIDHGNSGGPGFDTSGKVIGIATYGMQSQSGNYNFLRDIVDLEKVASANNVTLGDSPTFDLWQEGLSYFWIQHYREAEIPFGEIQKNYPIHPSVTSYIADSQTAIENGQDKSSFLFLIKNDRRTQLMVGGGFLTIAALGIVIIFLVRKRSRKNQIPPIEQPPVVPPASMPPPQVPTAAPPVMPQNNFPGI